VSCGVIGVNGSRALILVLIALVVGEADGVATIESADANPATSITSIETTDGLLTLKAEDVPLQQVLSEIAKIAGFKLVLVADLSELPRVKASFERLSAEEIVLRLVADLNRIIFYDIEEDGSGRRKLAQLWLLGPGDGSDIDNSDVGDERILFSEELQHDDGKIRSEAVLRLSLQATEDSSQAQSGGAVANKLGRILLRDHDPLVRVRAAIALGALRDQRAVPDLETALLDQHASVRAQVINALGQIGGDRATMVLGNFLLDQGMKTIERVMAAHALWKKNSDAANDYLRAGAEDSNVQVRLASSRAPSSAPAEFSKEQFGPQETE